MRKKRIGLLCAGQGSQYIGMGKDFYDRFDYVRKMYEDASKILDYDIAEICFSNNEFINETKYTQPAILVVTCSIYEVLKRTNLKILCGIGFSLGEYSALYASGVFDFPTVLSLVSKRASLMDELAKTNNGAMAAIIGLDSTKRDDLCKETKTQIANYNSPNQFVISGKKEDVLLARDRAISFGARRAVMLNVSGAFHHPLMKGAADKFKIYLDIASKNEPSFPVIMNYDALPLKESEVSLKLEKQIYSPVRFEESVLRMVNDYQINTLIEIGPGRILTGLAKRIVPEVQLVNIEKVNDITVLKEEE